MQHTAKDLLKNYESLGALEPDAGWEQQLLAKISTCATRKSSGKTGLQYAVIAILLLSLNLFFIVNLQKKQGITIDRRNEILHTVSDQVFIHATALK